MKNISIRTCSLAAGVALALAAVYLLRIGEDGGLPTLLPVIGAGFLVHSWLPFRYRQPFFVLLSLVGLLAVLGLQWGTAIVLVGLVLIGVCHLPVPVPIRTAILLLIAVLVAWLRGTGWRAQELPAAVAVLASMFMFRLIVYLYDIRHERSPSSLWTRLAYFFLLPNACFLVFPILDFSTFRRTYYDSDPVAIYERGLRRIVRGVSHLVLYRLVYHYLTPAQDEVRDLLSLVVMIGTSYAQLLRISGSFHLIVGILGLFGYNLPRPNYFYFLASSFTDYWRRANIYWKDLMVKVFLYPSFMRLRRTGVRQPLLLATFFVFFCTWLLHAWQWFWLLGTFRLLLTDVLFWTVFGVAVALNSIAETKRASPTAAPPGFSLGRASIHSLRVLAMFVSICLLWSFWSSPTIRDWLELMRAGANGGARQVLTLVAASSAALATGILAQWYRSRQRVRREEPVTSTKMTPSPKAAWLTAWAPAGALLLAAIGATQIEGSPVTFRSELLQAMASSHFSDDDLDRIEAGYYKELKNAPRLSSKALVFSRAQPQLKDSLPIFESREGGSPNRIRPSVDSTLSGQPFRSNRWGMRDQEYSREKPAYTYRIAIVGPSDTMGWGVGNDEVFEAVLEERLNRDHTGGRFERYEILNFSVHGLRPLEQLFMMRDRIMEFAPDAVFFVVHARDEFRSWDTIRRWRSQKIPLPDELNAYLAPFDTGDARTKEKVRQQRRASRPLMRWVFRRVGTIAREHGAVPVCVVLPGPAYHGRRDELDLLVEEARAEDLLVLNIGPVYDRLGRKGFRLASGDAHPSVRAHAGLAAELLERMSENDDILGAGLGD